MKMILITFLLVLVCADFGSSQEGGDMCPNGWSELSSAGEKLCYIYNAKRKLSWDDAKKFCQSAGATLPILKHTEETQFVYQLAGDVGNMWVGLSDIEVEGTWKWEDDSLFDNNADGIKWYVSSWSEPNGKRGENCAQLFSSSMLVDINCFFHAKVVCQRKAGNVATAVGDETIGSGCSEDSVYLETENGKVCYKWTGQEKMNWQQGKERCESEGASLPVLKSKSEPEFLWYLDVLSAYFQTGHFYPMGVWLGLTDKIEREIFWSDGTPLNSNTSNGVEWEIADPNNNGASGEYCVELNNTKQLVDNNCNLRKSIICQKKAATSAATPSTIPPSTPSTAQATTPAATPATTTSTIPPSTPSTAQATTPAAPDKNVTCLLIIPGSSRNNLFDFPSDAMTPDQPNPTIDAEFECGITLDRVVRYTFDISENFKIVTLIEQQLFTLGDSGFMTLEFSFKNIPRTIIGFSLESHNFTFRPSGADFETEFTSSSVTIHKPEGARFTAGTAWTATFDVALEESV